MRLPRNIENAIAQFRGLPKPTDADFSEGPKNIDSLLEVLVERYKIGTERPEQVIMANWVDIMGEANANRCAPERIDGTGRLVVSVANPILRRELHFNRARMMAKIRQLRGCDNIRDIDFRAG
jgi:hypothetical protein